MERNIKLNLKQRIQRSIRRRKTASPWVYICSSVVLMGVAVALRYIPLGGAAPEYDGIAGTGKFTATYTGNVNCVGDGKLMTTAEYEKYFDGVKGIFDKSDLLSVAINDPIIEDAVETYQSGMSIKFADRYFNSDFADALFDIGVRDATICNANIFRYGSKGALETSRLLESAHAPVVNGPEDAGGIAVSGLDTSSSADAAVYTRYLDSEKGVDIIHVGVETSDDRTRNYRSYDVRTYNDKDNNIVRDVTNLREQNPDAFIVVTVSWAEHYLLKPSNYMRDICHSIVDCGADMVVGTGIQMVLSAEKYGDGMIFYGLGNLVANEAYTMTQRGAVLNCVFDDAGDVTYEMVPLTVQDGRPSISDSSIILRTLVSDIGTSDYTIENGKLIIK